jgi:hypothetical protein
LCTSGGLLPAVEITVRKTAGEKYDRIIAHKLAETLPEPTGPNCGGCLHFAYGYCSVKSDYQVTPETEPCGEFLDLNDEVPF